VGQEVTLALKYRRKLLEAGPARVVRKHEVFTVKGKSITSGFGLAFVSADKKHLENIQVVAG
jgi:hypothetical protein